MGAKPPAAATAVPSCSEPSSWGTPDGEPVCSVTASPETTSAAWGARTSDAPQLCSDRCLARRLMILGRLGRMTAVSAHRPIGYENPFVPEPRLGATFLSLQVWDRQLQ